jgi:hypothetical protein
MDKQLKEWRIFAKEVCPYRTRDIARKSIGNPLCSVLHPCIKRCTYSRCSFAWENKPTPEEIVNSVRDAFVKDVKPDWDRWNAIKNKPCLK